MAKCAGVGCMLDLVCPHCGGALLVTSSEQISKTELKSYVQCLNTKECAASGVMHHSYEHDLKPPKLTDKQAAVNALARLSDDERRQLIEQLRGES